MSDIEYNELMIFLKKSFSTYRIDEDTKDDIFIESIITGLESFNDKKKTKLSTFIYSICRNNLNGFLKKKKNEIEYTDDIDTIDTIDTATDNIIDFIIDDSNTIKYNDIIDYIDDYNDKYNDIVKDFFINLFSYEELNMKYEKPIGTLKSIIFNFKNDAKNYIGTY